MKNATLLLCLLLCLFTLPQIMAQPASPCSCGSFDDVIGEDEQSETDISTVGTLGTCIEINGTLVINQTSLLLGKRISMTTGSSIRVESGVTFALTSSHIRSCEDLWQGIELEDDASLVFYSNVIADANHAIHFLADAACFIRNNEFVDNYIGISAGSPFDGSCTTKTVSSRGLILGNEFYTETTLHDPYDGHYYYPSWPSSSEIPYNQGYAAIYMCRTEGITFGLESEEEANTIHDMRNGVIIQEFSTTSVEGNLMEDFLGGLTQDFSDILDMNRVAVYCDNHSVLRMIENDIADASHGLRSNLSASRVLNNEIDVWRRRGTAGIEIIEPSAAPYVYNNSVTDGEYGIWLHNGYVSFNVDHNGIGKNNLIYGAGIYIQTWKFATSVPPAAIVNDNTVSYYNVRSARGIEFNLVNSVRADGNHIGFTADTEEPLYNNIAFLTDYTHNSWIDWTSVGADVDHFMKNNNRGFVSRNSSFNRFHCNGAENLDKMFDIAGSAMGTGLATNELGDGLVGLRLHPTTAMGPQIHLGNMWCGEYDYGGQIIGPNADITAENNRFFVDESDAISPCLFKPEDIDPPSIESDWFKDEDGEALTCTGGGGVVFSVDTLKKYLLEDPGFSAFNDELIWMRKAQLYELLLDSTQFLNDAVLDSFFDAEEVLPLGILVEASRDLVTTHGANRSSKDSLLTAVVDLVADISEIDSILNTHPNDSATWIALRENKVDTISNGMSTLESIWETEFETSKETWGDIQGDLVEQDISEDIADYYRDALVLYADIRLGNTLSGADSTAIRDLAELCLWKAGPAPSLAQGMLAYIGDTTYVADDYRYDCGLGAWSRQFFPPNVPTDISNAEISVYPNPAGETITVESTVNLLEIEIQTVTGKLVRIEEGEMGHSVLLDLSGLYPGIYFIKAVDEEGDSYTRRIVKAQ